MDKSESGNFIKKKNPAYFPVSNIKTLDQQVSVINLWQHKAKHHSPETEAWGFCCSLWRPSVDSGIGLALLVFPHNLWALKTTGFFHQGHVLQGDSTALMIICLAGGAVIVGNIKLVFCLFVLPILKPSLFISKWALQFTWIKHVILKCTIY